MLQQLGIVSLPQHLVNYVQMVGNIYLLNIESLAVNINFNNRKVKVYQGHSVYRIPQLGNINIIKSRLILVVSEINTRKLVGGICIVLIGLNTSDTVNGVCVDYVRGYWYEVKERERGDFLFKDFRYINKTDPISVVGSFIVV